MVVCKKCGNENPLGRVFCVKCGTKLDLSHMTSEHVEEIQKSWSDPLVKYWPKAAAAIGLLAIVLAGLALWPQTQLVGKPGTRVDGRKIDSALAALRTIRAGETRNMEFKEEEINGYFEFFKKSGMNLQSISASIQDGYLFLRIVQPLPSLAVSKFQFVPVMSYDLVCMPYSGGNLAPVKVSLGHLSMFGPLKTSAIQRVYAMFAKEGEWANLKPISDVKCSAGKMTIQAKK